MDAEKPNDIREYSEEFLVWSKKFAVDPGSDAGRRARRLDQWAREQQLSEKQVWQKIHQGQIAARQLGGETYVVLDADTRPGASARPALPLPGIPQPAARGHQEVLPEEPRADAAHPTETALLLDHLSLAREENKEVLQLARHSVERIDGVSRNLLETKDELISMKNQRITDLEARVQDREQTIRRLQQEVEDLRMLVESLKPFTDFAPGQKDIISGNP